MSRQTHTRCNCGRETWSVTGMCRPCRRENVEHQTEEQRRREEESIALPAGDWVLNPRTRVLERVPATTPLLTPEQYARYVQHRAAFREVGAA